MTHDGRIVDTSGGRNVLFCDACQFVHVDPLPTEAELDAYYDTVYYSQTKPSYFTDAEADGEWWRLVHGERLDLMGDWLRLDGITTRQVLDVGSGPGYFLSEAVRRGWEAVGIEPSKQARAYCQARWNIPVYDLKFRPGVEELVGTGFDVIQMHEVLEHLSDPIASLQLAHAMLKPGGLVLVVVPNDYSKLQDAVMQTRLEKWWLAPEHLNYFSVPSLHGLLRRCGFSVGHVSTTFPLELFLLMGLDYVGKPDVGRYIHTLRKELELQLDRRGLGEAKRDLYRAFGLRGIGRDIVMLARKPATTRQEAS